MFLGSPDEKEKESVANQPAILRCVGFLGFCLGQIKRVRIGESKYFTLPSLMLMPLCQVHSFSCCLCVCACVCVCVCVCARLTPDRVHARHHHLYLRKAPFMYISSILWLLLFLLGVFAKGQSISYLLA
jgi:hypothetical protein